MDRGQEKWKRSRSVLKAVIQYVKTTGKFQPRAVIAEEAEEAETVEPEQEAEVVNDIGERDEEEERSH